MTRGVTRCSSLRGTGCQQQTHAKPQITHSPQSQVRQARRREERGERREERGEEDIFTA
jgi:hypothetical protein